MASSSAECSWDKPPFNFVRKQELTLWDIVCFSPQGHKSVAAWVHNCIQTPQWPRTVRKRLSRDHCCRGRLKPGCQIVGSSLGKIWPPEPTSSWPLTICWNPGINFGIPELRLPNSKMPDLETKSRIANSRYKCGIYMITLKCVLCHSLHPSKPWRWHRERGSENRKICGSVNAVSPPYCNYLVMCLVAIIGCLVCSR